MADKSVKFSIKAQDKTAATFAKVRKKVTALNKSAIGLGATIAGAVGIGAFSVMAKGAMEGADKIHKLSLRLGASAEALSQYRHVADLSGVSFDTFAMGLQRMTRRISEAGAGTGVAGVALDELGISVGQLVGLKPEEQFEMLAEAISKVQDPADKVRLAMKLFDSEGVSLIQMMEGGATGIKDMREEADALGMTLTDSMVEKVAEANDSIAKVTGRIKALVEKLMVSLSPSLIEIANLFGDWIDVNRELIGQNMATVFDNLKQTFTALAPVVKTAWAMYVGLGKAIGWVAFQVVRVVEAVNRALPSFDSIRTFAEPLTNLLPSFGGDEEATDNFSAQSGGQSTGTFGGSSITNNFNTQITRGDAVAIASEANRQTYRQ